MHAPTRQLEVSEIKAQDDETRKVKLAFALALAAELIAVALLLLWVFQAA